MILFVKLNVFQASSCFLCRNGGEGEGGGEGKEDGSWVPLLLLSSALMNSKSNAPAPLLANKNNYFDVIVTIS